jgi:DNA-binding protein H-NS
MKGTAMSEVTPQKPAKPPAKKPATFEPKFRGPNGETWSGRGMTPKWMTDMMTKK